MAGSSGQVSGGSLDHPAMHLSVNVLGSVILDIDGNRLDATFLDQEGVVQDYYTIIKGATCPDPDGDVVCTNNDNCPDNPNPNQDDADGDGSGDVCDPCPDDPAKAWCRHLLRPHAHPHLPPSSRA